MKGKSKTRALGDDPLSWIVKDSIKPKSAQKGQGKNGSAKQASEDNILAERSSNELVEASSEKTQSKAKKVRNAKSTKSAKNNLSRVDAVGSKKPTKTPSDTVKSASNLYKLDPIMTVSQSTGLKERFSALLENNASDIALDGSAVENIDSAALQLLLAFVMELKARNCKVLWPHISPQLLSRSQTLGLSAVFGMDEAAS
ncbi:MAG: STAS domain-containing protein [Porticoccaceae bacterium]